MRALIAIWLLFVISLSAFGQAFTLRNPSFAGNIRTPGGGAAGSSDNFFQFIGSLETNVSASASTTVLKVSGLSPGQLIVVGAKSEGGQTHSSCVANVSGTWSNLTTQTSGTSESVRLFYTTNASGSDTQITITHSAATTFRYVYLQQYASDTLARLDVETGTNGTASTVLQTPSITTAGKGLVVSFYGAFNNVTTKGFAFGTNSGVNTADVTAGYSRMWGVQTAGASSGRASLTTASGVTYCIATAAFKGSGTNNWTGTNFAHVYVTGTNQTPGTTLTVAIATNSTVGQPDAWSMSPATPTGLAVQASRANLKFPLMVANKVYQTNYATTSWGVTGATTLTYALLSVNDHRQMVISGILDTETTSGTGLIDAVRVDSVGGKFAIIQLNLSTHLFNIETNPGGVTTHSTGFTYTDNTIYKYCMLVDFGNTICSIKVWKASDSTVVLNENATIDSAVDDLDFVKIGNVEAGTATGNTYFEQTAINWWASSYPFEP